MKSLNDLIWNKDSDLEEEKKDDLIKLEMKEICIVNSCKRPPECGPYTNIYDNCSR